MKLCELSKLYLKTNGISYKFFARYLGIEYSYSVRWLNGDIPINEKYIDKIHEFLNGEWITPASELLKKGENNYV